MANHSNVGYRKTIASPANSRDDYRHHVVSPPTPPPNRKVHQESSLSIP